MVRGDESRLASVSCKTFQAQLAIKVDVIQPKDRESSRERARFFKMKPDVGFVEMRA